MQIGQEAGSRQPPATARSRPAGGTGRGASRSSLLTKVMIGTSRSRQTSKSLRVCSPTPFGASGAASGYRGQGAVGVLAKSARRAQGLKASTNARSSSPPRRPRCRAHARPPSGTSAPAAARLDLARQLDRAAKQQQLLGQCRLPASGCKMIARCAGANLVRQGSVPAWPTLRLRFHERTQSGVHAAQKDRALAR